MSAHEWIGKEFREQVSTQTYGGTTTIDGVRFIDRTIHHDEGGDFCEVVRLGPDGDLLCLPGYRPAQLSWSLMEPGTVKAWHLHREQDDLWFVPPSSRLLVGLLDVRAGSPSERTVMRFALGAGSARLLLIPRGVAHGVANLRSEPGSILYLANNAFNPANPDEHRLPANLLGADFWTIRHG